MASLEDAATVLEQFCHDVANLPAEIAHLLEEIQAKDTQIMQCRDVISQRDNAIQKHIRTAGSHARHPKEDAFTKTVIGNYDKVEILQAEKLGLSQKAMTVLERQIKRFDVKLRDLQSTDQFPLDPSLPSLLQHSAANVAPPLSGVSTPLQSVSVNTAQGGGAPNIANAAAGRLAGAGTSRIQAALSQNPILNQPHLATTTNRSSRESSADTNKRRRLNPSGSNMSLAIPAAPSSLRQSSAGATTPKPGTPGPTTSRQGSAQPTRPPARKAPSAVGTKKLAPTQAATTTASGTASNASRKRIRPGKKGDRRRQLAREQRGGVRGSPSASPTPSTSRASTSPTPSSLQQKGGDDSTIEVKKASRHRHEEDDDDEEEGGEDDDTKVYCTCQRPSFGDMVGCDNANCKYEWFHLECVNLKQAPQGDWLCPFCRELPESEIERAT